MWSTLSSNFTCFSAWNTDVHHNKGRVFLPSRFKRTKMAQCERRARPREAHGSPGDCTRKTALVQIGCPIVFWQVNHLIVSAPCKCIGLTDIHSVSNSPPWLKHTNTPGTGGLPAPLQREWRSQLGPAANTKPLSQPVAPSVIPSASTLLIDLHFSYLTMMLHYLRLITNMPNEIAGKVISCHRWLFCRYMEAHRMLKWQLCCRCHHALVMCCVEQAHEVVRAW